MKTDGATWKEYLRSWPEGQWFDDSDETINGKPGDDVEFEEIQDTDIVEFSCGIVYPTQESLQGFDLVKHFRAWMKAKTHTNVLVSIPKDMMPYLLDLLRANGCKVLFP
jgi:acid phosphatase class B